MIASMNSIQIDSMIVFYWRRIDYSDWDWCWDWFGRKKGRGRGRERWIRTPQKTKKQKK